MGFKEVTPGFTDADGIRVLGRCLLYEVSLTPMAANINAVFETNPNGSLKGITMNTGSTRTTPEVGLDCVRSITLEGVPWAWCPTTRARAGQDKQWLRPLPGIVSVRTTPLWEVIEYRQAESVADLVRLYRPTLGKSSAIILWTYCSDGSSGSRVGDVTV